MKTLFTTLTLAAAFIVSSCSDNEDNLHLIFKGTNEAYKPTRAASVALRITDFQLSIRDVEFKMNESDLATGNVQFRGPFDVDLMCETSALSQTIGELDVPEGKYKVLRFKLHKSTSRPAANLLYDRSIFIKGTINGANFEFWHDTSENFDFENATGIAVYDNTIKVAVSFNMDLLLNASAQINLALAQDTDGDGLIEINPNNDDGNGSIASQLKINIKAAANLVKL